MSLQRLILFLETRNIFLISMHCSQRFPVNLLCSQEKVEGMPETGVERTDTGRVFRYYSTLLYTTRLNLIKRYYRIYIYIQLLYHHLRHQTQPNQEILQDIYIQILLYHPLHYTRLNLIKRYYRIYIFRYYSRLSV